MRFSGQDPEDIIETGKFFESANANALEQYCNDFYPKLINGHGAPKGYNSMLEDDWNSDNILPWEKNDVSFGHQIAVKMLLMKGLIGSGRIFVHATSF